MEITKEDHNSHKNNKKKKNTQRKYYVMGREVNYEHFRLISGKRLSKDWSDLVGQKYNETAWQGAYERKLKSTKKTKQKNTEGLVRVTFLM